MKHSPDTVRQALALLDLTRLEDDDSEAELRLFCRRADTPFGHPAAVCVYPAFVVAARRELEAIGIGQRVAVATVANFPAGRPDPAGAATEVRQAIALGADEVDVVFPWQSFKYDNDEATGRSLVAACREACGEKMLKVILETGELAAPSLVQRAAELAVAEGADFLKTSTGKTANGATLEAVDVLLSVIESTSTPVGLKVSGGVSSVEDAVAYLSLVAERMGRDWIRPAHVRIGASGLLDQLLAALEQGA